MEKILYVVSSRHFSDNPEVNEAQNVAEILETRLEVIAGIARGAKEGTFFCDSVEEEMAASFNGLIIGSPNTISKMIEEFYSGAPFDKMYDYARTTALLCSLRQEGINFLFAPTEDGFFEEMVQHYYNRIFPTHNHVQEFERRSNDPVFMEMVTGEMMRLRDESCLGNIQRYGSQENILFMGRDHKLSCLLQFPLDWYKVNIDEANGAQKVAGFLPLRFEGHMKISPETKSGKPVEVKINYI